MKHGVIRPNVLEKGIWQSAVKEEHVVKEIVERLWYQARIKVWRIRERIPNTSKRWQQLSTPGIPDLFFIIPKNTVEVGDADL